MIKVNPGFFGANPTALQQTLEQLGRDGWELVSATSPSQPYFSILLFLKRPL